MATITREVMKALRRDIEEALGNVANKHGVTLELGNGRFNDREGHFKLNIVAPDSEGLTTCQAAYDLRAASEGWVPRGAVVMLCNKKFVVDGYNEKAPRFPISLMGLRGKRFRAQPGEWLKVTACCRTCGLPFSVQEARAGFTLCEHCERKEGK